MKVLVTDEGLLPEIVQYGPSSRFECFTASKGSNNYFYLLCFDCVNYCFICALHLAVYSAYDMNSLSTLLSFQFFLTSGLQLRRWF